MKLVGAYTEQVNCCKAVQNSNPQKNSVNTNYSFCIPIGSINFLSQWWIMKYPISASLAHFLVVRKIQSLMREELHKKTFGHVCISAKLRNLSDKRALNAPPNCQIKTERRVLAFINSHTCGVIILILVCYGSITWDPSAHTRTQHKCFAGSIMLLVRHI